MNIPLQQLQGFLTHPHPLALLALFVTVSFLMIWRLQAMESKGFEGTLLGTLIMPYCSGCANLTFAYVMSRSSSNGGLVIENSIVNNVTNLTLILGLAILFAPAAIASAKSKSKGKIPGKIQGIERLNLLFTLIALFLFSGTLWALANDGVIDFYDGLVLTALFVFWQILHVFELLKNNIRKNTGFHWSILIDLLMIAACAYGIYWSVDQLVDWVAKSGNRVFSFTNIGWLSGWLMVLPNAFLALYYTRVGRQDIVLSSQVGDGHICIPMCIGLFALFSSISVPALFQTGIFIILGAGALHFLLIALLGRTPRFIGVGLIGSYGFFLYQGLIK